MILLILSVIIILTIAIVSGKASYPFDWGSCIATIVVGAIAYFILEAALLVIVSSCDKYNTVEYKDQPIKSFTMDKQSSISGNFVLGCGVVEGGTYDSYVSYAQFPEGLLRIKCDAYKTYILECDSTPIIKKYWVRDVFTGFSSKWIGTVHKRLDAWEVNTSGKKTIIVPKNTVYLEFKKIE